MADKVTTAVWAYGKVEPGWYMACLRWRKKEAERLRDMGYEVKQSKRKPK